MFGYIFWRRCAAGPVLPVGKWGSVCMTSVVIRITTYIYAAVMISQFFNVSTFQLFNFQRSTTVTYVQTMNHDIIYHNITDRITSYRTGPWRVAKFCKISKEFHTVPLISIMMGYGRLWVNRVLTVNRYIGGADGLPPGSACHACECNGYGFGFYRINEW